MTAVRANQPRIFRMNQTNVTQMAFPRGEALTTRAGDEVSAMAFDSISRIAIAVVNTNLTANFIKISMPMFSSSSRKNSNDNDNDEEFEVLGSQATSTNVTDDRRIAAMMIVESSRIVYLLQRSMLGVAVRRYALYEVLGTNPTIADRRGGTLLTVFGRGFVPTNTTSCSIGNKIVPATVISESELTCVSQESDASLCEDDTVEVAIFQSVFTVNKVGIIRIEAPRLEAVTPMPQDYRSVFPVTVQGSGFVQSTSIKCRYATKGSNLAISSYTSRKNSQLGGGETSSTIVSVNATKMVIVTTLLPTTLLPGNGSGSNLTTIAPPVATPVPSTSSSSSSGETAQIVDGTLGSAIESVVCGVPVLTGAWIASVDIAIDGSVFTGKPVPMIYTGEPAGIFIDPTTIKVISQPATLLQPFITVNFVDGGGSIMGAQFTTIVDVLIAIERWNPAATVEEEILEGGSGSSSSTVVMPNSEALSALTIPTVQNLEPRTTKAGKGFVTFDNLVLIAPKAGELTFNFSIRSVYTTQVYQWSGRCSVTIEAGSLAQISWVQQPSKTLDQNGALLEKPVLNLLDSSGNSVGQAANQFIVVAHLSEQLQPDVTIPSYITENQKLLTNFNASVRAGDGQAAFNNFFDNLNVRGGYQYKFLIYVEGKPKISIWSRVMTPKCLHGEFRPLGQYQCQTCLAHTICDGTLQLEVSPGYWRPTFYAAAVYSCNPKQACLGGNATPCAMGYEGPVCRVCSSGYGKSIGGRCVKCYSLPVAILLTLLLIVGVVAVLAACIVLAAQNWNRSSRSVVILMLLVTQCQTMIQIGNLDLPYPDYFKYIMSWVNTLFDLRVLEVSFSDCVMRSDGTDFLTRFTVYSLTPLLALFIASLAWLLLFLWPNMFRVSEFNYNKHEKRQQLKKLKRRGMVYDPEKDRDKERWYTSALNEMALLESQLGTKTEREQVYAINDYKFLALIGVQVVLFFTYCATVSYALHMLECLEVDDGDGVKHRYLAVDVTVSCDSTSYRTFKTLAILVAVLFLVAMPLGYVAGYQFHARYYPFHVMERKQLFSFWNQGLKATGWFWPAVLFARKGILTAFVMILPEQIDAYVSMWFLVLYTPLLLYIAPYERKKNTYLEGFGVVMDVLAINIGLILPLMKDDMARGAVAFFALFAMFLACIVYGYYSSQRIRILLHRALRRRVLHENLTSSDSEEATWEQEAERKSRGLVKASVRETLSTADPSSGSAEWTNTTSVAAAPVPVADAKQESVRKLLDSLQSSQQREENEEYDAEDPRGTLKKMKSSSNMKEASDPLSAQHKRFMQQDAARTTYVPTFNREQYEAVQSLTTEEKLAMLSNPHEPLPTVSKPVGSTLNLKKWRGGVENKEGEQNKQHSLDVPVFTSHRTYDDALGYGRQNQRDGGEKGGFTMVQGDAVNESDNDMDNDNEVVDDDDQTTINDQKGKPKNRKKRFLPQVVLNLPVFKPGRSVIHIPYKSRQMDPTTGEIRVSRRRVEEDEEIEKRMAAHRQAIEHSATMMQHEKYKLQAPVDLLEKPQHQPSAASAASLSALQTSHTPTSQSHTLLLSPSPSPPSGKNNNGRTTVPPILPAAKSVGRWDDDQGQPNKATSPGGNALFQVPQRPFHQYTGMSNNTSAQGMLGEDMLNML